MRRVHFVRERGGGDGAHRLHEPLRERRAALSEQKHAQRRQRLARLKLPPPPRTRRPRRARRVARRALQHRGARPPPPTPPPPPTLVLSGHAASLTPYYVDTPRPSPRTNRTRRVPLAGVPRRAGRAEDVPQDTRPGAPAARRPTPRRCAARHLDETQRLCPISTG